jgi:hypothetical protein
LRFADLLAERQAIPARLRDAGTDTGSSKVLGINKSNKT